MKRSLAVRAARFSKARNSPDTIVRLSSSSQSAGRSKARRAKSNSEHTRPAMKNIKHNNSLKIKMKTEKLKKIIPKIQGNIKSMHIEILNCKWSVDDEGGKALLHIIKFLQNFKKLSETRKNKVEVAIYFNQKSTYSK